MISKSRFLTGDAIAATYQPIVSTYFVVAAIYYALMTIANIWYTEPDDIWAMASLSGASAIFITCCAFALKRTRSLLTMEILITLVNLTMLGNVLHALHVQFDTVKLVYFVIMAMIFGLTSLSLRQSAFSTLVALAALAWQVYGLEAEVQIIYGFVSFGAALSSLAIAHYLRRAFGQAIASQQLANAAREKAEVRLEGEISIGETLRHQSFSDSLTNLPNRRAFFEKLDTSLNAEQTGEEHWLALLDLDGFKLVNDSHGHLVGDRLLKSIAFRLRYFCQDQAHISRIGGDEFAIVFERGKVSKAPEEWCNSLLEKLCQPFPIDGRLIQISGSIGCRAIDPNIPATKLFHEADFALLHAKRCGKNMVVPFDEDHAKAASRRQGIEQALRDANFDKEISLVFQPQYNLQANQIVAAEALARWSSPEIGVVAPDDFIQIAEECGLIANISLAVIKQAIAALKTWPEPVALSVNLSANDLNSDQTMDAIIELLRADPIAAHLEFEVTETAMLYDTQRATHNLRRLAELGHKIAIDDFGTGYSNFSYLRALPINKLKIDRSFLKDLSDPMTEKMLKSLVGMANTLGVECLLEGVEDELSLVMAKRSGAGMVQGFLLGRPTDAQTFGDAVAASKRPSGERPRGERPNRAAEQETAQTPNLSAAIS